MKYTYPKHEKLKSKRAIDLLFTEGKSVSKYPLRLVYVAVDVSVSAHHVYGVSVSKKHFKKAVDRNYFKRVLRECLRFQKHNFTSQLAQPHAFMLMYQTKEKLSFQEIEVKMQQLVEKFLYTEASKEQ